MSEDPEDRELEDFELDDLSEDELEHIRQAVTTGVSDLVKRETEKLKARRRKRAMSDVDLDHYEAMLDSHPRLTPTLPRDELRWLLEQARAAEQYRMALNEVGGCKQCDVCPHVALLLPVRQGLTAEYFTPVQKNSHRA